MEIDEIRIYALSLPDTEECFPFGENNLVLKTKGKIFIILEICLCMESARRIKTLHYSRRKLTDIMQCFQGWTV